MSEQEDLLREIVSILLGCVGLALVVASPAVSARPWLRAKALVEWAVELPQHA